MGMWSSYKKRVVPSQIFVVMCTLLYAFVTGNWEWQRLLLVFLLLEMFSLLGAWAGARAERIMERENMRTGGR